MFQMFMKSSRMEIEDRKLSEIVGSRRKESECTKISKKIQLGDQDILEEELLYINDI